tara:strand:+ start:171 stop:1019 length:849 start_codon:yes stop_codon:yes gene_type:complete
MTEIIKTDQPIVDTKQFHLSTRGDAGMVLNGDYKSQIVFSIPDAVVADDSIDFIYFSIPYAVIPNSFYVINETNNQLYVLQSSVTTLYTFPLGNYTTQSFINTFKTLLPSTFNITLGQNSNRFTITHTTTTFSLTSASTIDSIMGFTGTVAATGLTLTLPRVCNFLPEPRICIRCADLANSLMTATNNSSDVILAVPNTSRLNGQIIYTNNSNMKTLFKLTNLNQFYVSLTNDDGVPINFNGVSSFFTFQFDIHRKTLAKPMPFDKLVNFVNSQSLLEPMNN